MMSKIPLNLEKIGKRDLGKEILRAGNKIGTATFLGLLLVFPALLSSTLYSIDPRSSLQNCRSHRDTQRFPS
jgi:hypothetical protein